MPMWLFTVRSLKLWIIFQYTILIGLDGDGSASSQSIEAKYKIEKLDQDYRVIVKIDGMTGSKDACRFSRLLQSSTADATIYSWSEELFNKNVTYCANGKSYPYEFEYIRMKYIKVNFISGTLPNNVAPTKVYGFQIPLLTIPIVRFNETDRYLAFLMDKKLMDSCVIFCGDKLCPYGHNRANDVEHIYDIYEVSYMYMTYYLQIKCLELPTIFYHVPNKHMKDTIEIFKPQYDVVYNGIEGTHTYTLKFTNQISSNICGFSIRKLAKLDGTASEYVSKCGEKIELSLCYTPCRDVRLVLNEKVQLVEVLIQNRFHDLSNPNSGFANKKFGIINWAGGWVIILYIVLNNYPKGSNGMVVKNNSGGFILDASVYKPISTTEGYSYCDFKYYIANSKKPKELTALRCSDGQICDNGCLSLTFVDSFLPGVPYIISMMATISGYPVYEEKIFFRPKGRKLSGRIIDFELTESNRLTLKPRIDQFDKPYLPDYCYYYVSARNDNLFYAAECADGDCPAMCNVERTLVGIDPNTNYKIKLVFAKTFDDFNLEFKGGLQLNHTYTRNGVRIGGNFMFWDSRTIECGYVIKEKKFSFYKTLYNCPLAEKSSQINNQPYHETLTSQGIFELGKVTQREKSTSNSCPRSNNCDSFEYEDKDAAFKEYLVCASYYNKFRVQECKTIYPEKINKGPTEKSKQIKVLLSVDGFNLKVQAKFHKDDYVGAQCQWKLAKVTSVSYVTEKTCFVADEGYCDSKLPQCVSFTIFNIEPTQNYALTVYLSSDKSYYGSNTTMKNNLVVPISYKSTGSKQRTTIIVVAVVALVIIVIIMVTAFLIFKKRSFSKYSFINERRVYDL